MASMDREERKAAPPSFEADGAVWRTIKYLAFLALLALVASLAWHGKKTGRVRVLRNRPAGQPEEVALAQASIIWPWEWTAGDWASWWTWTQTFGIGGREAVSPAIAALRERAAAYARKPKAAARSGQGPQGPDVFLPPEFARADSLLREGITLWEANDLQAARPKLDEALARLTALHFMMPANPTVTDAYEVASQIVEAIDLRKR